MDTFASFLFQEAYFDRVFRGELGSKAPKAMDFPTRKHLLNALQNPEVLNWRSLCKEDSEGYLEEGKLEVKMF